MTHRIKDNKDSCQEVFSTLFGNDVRIVHVELALRVGVPKAMILAQIDYWLKRSKKVMFRIPWIYNTYEDWQAQFPFYSYWAIRKWLRELEDEGLIKSNTQLNRSKSDRTKWYTINYESLDKLLQTAPPQEV